MPERAELPLTPAASAPTAPTARAGLPRWAAPLLAGGLLLGQLGRIPLASFGLKQIPLLALDVAVLAVVTWGMLSWVRRGGARIDRAGWTGLVFAAVGLTGTVVSIVRYDLGLAAFAASSAYLARWLTYFGLLLVTSDLAGEADRRRWWRALETAALVVAGFGIVQSALLPDFAQLVYPDTELYTQWDPQGRRLVSTFLDPNLVGGFLLLVLLQQVGIVSLAGERVRRSPDARPSGAVRPAELARIALVGTALLLTVSRGTALAAVVGIITIVAALRGIPRRAAGIATVLTLALLPVIPLALALAVSMNKFDLLDPSLLARFVDWAQAGVVFLDHPVLGVGFNTYGFVQREVYGFREWTTSSFGLDGGLLFIAVLTGTVGLVLYGSLLALVMRGLAHTLHNDESPGARGMALGLIAGIPALLVHSLFTNSLLYPMTLAVVWMGAGTTIRTGAGARSP